MCVYLCPESRQRRGIWLPVKDAKSIWERYSLELSEDFLYDPMLRQRTNAPFAIEIGRATALQDLHRLCHERNIDPHLHLPQPNLDTRLRPTCKVAQQEMRHDPEEQRRIYESLYGLIQDNPEQLDAWNAVISALAGGPNVIYLDGPAGSGKTTLYNGLMAYLRAAGKVVLPHAFSGIAAQQLSGGKTIHSRFRLPVPLPLDDASCGLSLDTDTPKLLKLATLIIWDEGPNAPLAAFDAVDRFFKELMGCDRAFGGKVMLIGGDFRQIPPVLRRIDSTAVRQYSLHAASFFTSSSTVKHTLKRNMRAAADNKFAEFVLSVGDGTYTDIPDGVAAHLAAIRLPSCLAPEGVTSDSLMDWVYSDFPSSQSIETLSKYYTGRAVVTTTNADADRVNVDMLEKLHPKSQRHVYLSQDTILEASDAEKDQFPEDFLNGVASPGIPPHRLELCRGALVMCLRNVAPDLGLCNGTRGIVISLRKYLVELRLLLPGGSSSPRTVWVPRILCDSSADADLPFTMRRRQFPLKPCWAMTINKSQGATFKTRLGIWLPRPVFAHGQLYVALSRAGSFANVRMLVDENPGMQGRLAHDGTSSVFTLNVVDRAMLIPSVSRSATTESGAKVAAGVTLDPLLPHAVSSSVEVVDDEHEDAFDAHPVAPQEVRSERGVGPMVDALAIAPGSDLVALALQSESQGCRSNDAYTHAMQSIPHAGDQDPVEAALWGGVVTLSVKKGVISAAGMRLIISLGDPSS